MSLAMWGYQRVMMSNGPQAATYVDEAIKAYGEQQKEAGKKELQSRLDAYKADLHRTQEQVATLNKKLCEDGSAETTKLLALGRAFAKSIRKGDVFDVPAHAFADPGYCGKWVKKVQRVKVVNPNFEPSHADISVVRWSKKTKAWLKTPYALTYDKLVNAKRIDT